MDHDLTLNEWRERNEPQPPPRCGVCGVYDGETAHCDDKNIDFICPDCAEKGQMYFCEGCSGFKTLFGPSGEECQDCYETSIDTAHDYLSGDR